MARRYVCFTFFTVIPRYSHSHGVRCRRCTFKQIVCSLASCHSFLWPFILGMPQFDAMNGFIWWDKWLYMMRWMASYDVMNGFIWCDEWLHMMAWMASYRVMNVYVINAYHECDVMHYRAPLSMNDPDRCCHETFVSPVTAVTVTPPSVRLWHPVRACARLQWH